MFRKNVVGLFVAFLILAAGVVYVFTIFLNKENSSEPIAAIPLDASVVMRFSSAQQFVNLKDEGAEFQKILANTAWFRSFTEQELSVSKIFEGNEVLQHLFTSTPLFCSIHPLGKGGNRAAFFLQIPPEIHTSQLNGLTTYLEERGIKIESSIYQGSDVLHLQLGKNFNLEIYYAIVNRIAILSSNRMIVEAAIRQLSSGESLLKSEGFKLLWKTLGDNSTVNMLVNGRKISATLQPLLGNTLTRSARLLDKMADWIAVDGYMHSNAFIANGFTLASDSTNRFFRIFLHQSPLPVKISEVLPASVSCFVSYGISDIDGFIKDYTSYLDKENKLYAHNVRLAEWEQGGDFNLDRFFRVGKTNAITSLYYHDASIDSGGCWLNLYSFGDPETAKLLAKENLNLLMKKTGKQPVAQELTVGKEKIPVYNLPSSDLSKAMFEGLVIPFSENVGVFYLNYFITAPNVAAMQSFLNSMAGPEKLRQTSSYQSVLPYVASMGNVFFYFNPFTGSNLINTLDNSPLQLGLQKYPELFASLGGVGVQFRSLKGKLFTNLFVTTPASVLPSTGSNLEWTYKADSLICGKPYVFLDYKSRRQELAFCDLKNQFYLLKLDGTLDWKKKIDDQVMGDIHCVDYFRNHKYQLFFTTKKSVYLIDRNGDVVDGFPIILPSPATAEASIFDYDNNGENRIFVPVADGRVLLYDKEGREVKGWRFKTTTGVVSSPVDYIRQKGKDYITLHDGIKFYFLDRRGRDRIAVNKSLLPSTNALCYACDGDNGFLLPTKSGEIVKLKADGTYSSFIINPSDAGYYFIYADLNGNKRSDVIIADGNQLQVFDEAEKKIFAVKFDGEIEATPAITAGGGGGKKNILVQTNQAKSYLVNSSGSILPGFPLNGSIFATYIKPDDKVNTYSIASVTSSGEVKFYRFKEQD